MTKRKILYHLGIRIGILLLLLISISIYAKVYSSDQFAFFLIQAYCLFLLLEMIYLFVKKKRNLGLINLTIIIIIEILPLIVLYRLLV
jgi:hypothetical protein